MANLVKTIIKSKPELLEEFKEYYKKYPAIEFPKKVYSINPKLKKIKEKLVYDKNTAVKNNISILTRWDFPEEEIQDFSKIYKNDVFKCFFAEELNEDNSGIVYIQNGKTIKSKYELSNKEIKNIWDHDSTFDIEKKVNLKNK